MIGPATLIRPAEPRDVPQKLVGKLFSANEASIELAHRCGFRVVGTHLRHGRLEGDRKGVLVVERQRVLAGFGLEQPGCSAIDHGVSVDIPYKDYDSFQWKLAS